MKQRPLGRTGITVSEVSFGCVEIGLPYGIGVADESQMLSETEAVRLLRTALDNGITLYDTAPAYGRSETILGRAFDGVRDEVAICTKCRDLHGPEGKLLPIKELQRTVRESLSTSLRALRRDAVDVFLIHRSTPELLSHPGVPAVFSRLKRDGLVRAVGVSTYGVESSRQAVDSGAWDVVQVAFNLLDQTNEPVLAQARAQGVGVMVRSVLFKGVLTDRGRTLHPALADVARHRQVYQSLLGPEVPTLAALATAFVLSQGTVSTALLGIDRPEYLQQALAAARAAPLSPARLQSARQFAYPDPGFLDLPKWDRMGWLT